MIDGKSDVIFWAVEINDWSSVICGHSPELKYTQKVQNNDKIVRKMDLLTLNCSRAVVGVGGASINYDTGFRYLWTLPVT
jgi:hypothetical protein